jgi:HemY protein
MRRVAWLLLAILIVVGAALWIALLPGAIRFEAGDLSIDAATPTLVFALLLAAAAAYALIRLIVLTLHLPRRLRARRALTRRRDGDQAVTQALVALAAANQSDALRATARARKKLGDTPQTLLLAAQAHKLAGQPGQAAAHFTTLAANPDSALIGLRGLLRLAIARQDWPEARTLADRAERAYPGNAWLREERTKLLPVQALVKQ